MTPTASLRTIFALMLMAQAAMATPEIYHLQPELSSVGFETDFGPDKISGTMPVASANLTLDFAHVAASKVAVTLNAKGSNASFPFAAQAMRGPKVLDTAEFPEISFVSTSVQPEAQGAAVAGNITIRGVTRPASFHAEIWRQQGTVEGDLSHLTIRLTGAIKRSDFGAVGWGDMVGDEVRLNILARIERTN
ncbi:MAG: YceI family protein [Cypionkella sp.]